MGASDQKGKHPAWVKAAKIAGLIFLVLFALFILFILVGLMIGGETAPNDPYDFGPAANPWRGMTGMMIIIGAVLGAGLVSLFAFWRFLTRRYGWAVLAGLAVILWFIGDTSDQPGISGITALLGFGLGLVAGGGIAAGLFLKIRPPKTLENVFGSSRWAAKDDLTDWGLLGTQDSGNGLFLGLETESGEPIVYEGDMHALTVAPTRTGKGATAIIPNLLRSHSSILVIDPKGENARRTAAKREAMGQQVYIVDPWEISRESDRYGEGVKGELIARFNPLGALDKDDPDLASDAMMLADALVIEAEKDPFWTNEAKALVYGFILYVVSAPEEKGHRHLGRVREILSLPAGSESDEDEDLTGTLDEILIRMAASEYPLVRSAAYRFVQKAEKERSGVISTAQSNTHFLESPKITESLGTSDFRFADLKTGERPVTVYLVLPLDRLSTFNRWLRLIITSALIDLTRTPADPERPPVRVILDEFAALEKLTLIESAYATMAGLGVQLWAVTQDLSQLMRLYGDKGWQSFISNAGVFQYFGSRDFETAKYAEHLTGMTTLTKRSISFGKNWGSSRSARGGSSSSGGSETINHDDVQRPLAYADQMMTLDRDQQVLFIENRHPIMARKYWWFKEQV